MMRYLLFTIFFALLLIGSSCRKEKSKQPDPALPPITAEGKNTFGCMVNGVLFLPNEDKDYAYADYHPWVESHALYGSLELSGIKDHYTNGVYAGMTIELKRRVFGTGKYLVYSNQQLSEILSYRADFKDYSNFIPNDTYSFISISRLDTINRIVAGTFQFRVVDINNNTDTLKVTDGRFDFQF